MRILNRLEETLIAVLMAAATIIIFLAILQRYATGVPALYPYARTWDFTWAQELCIYMFVWMASSARPTACAPASTSASTSSSTCWASSGGVRWSCSDCCAARCSPASSDRSGPTWFGTLAEIGQVSQDLEVPMWIVYLCVPLGSYLMCFRFLQVAWAYARSGELPRHDHAEVKGLEEETQDRRHGARHDRSPTPRRPAAPQPAARPHHLASF